MKVKLDPDLKAKLLAKNSSLESAVNDACELLTMKVSAVDSANERDQATGR